jgi:hypothetical protein
MQVFANSLQQAVCYRGYMQLTAAIVEKGCGGRTGIVPGDHISQTLVTVSGDTATLIQACCENKGKKCGTVQAPKEGV